MKKNGKNKRCLICNTEFYVPKCHLTAQFCQAKCQHESMRGVPLSEEHRKKVSAAVRKNLPSTAFKKGHTPALKGTHNRETGYSALHKWLYTQVGKAKQCTICDSTRFVTWANISGEYRHDVDDFKELCRSCHNKFDGTNQGLKPRLRYTKNWRVEFRD